MAKILLVEDNEMNRDLISRRLKRAGYEVSMAFDGAEGIERVKSVWPDLILMDMGLPVLDGYEATRVLKSTSATQHVPILGLSAHAMSGDAAKALAAGCDDYDTKPVEWPRLRAKITALLQQAQQTATQDDLTAQNAAVETAGQPGMKVLVASDNILHRRLLGERLAALGYAVSMAEDGPQFQAALAQGCDALLLGLRLGELSGQEILAQWRAHSPEAPCPVLMICPPDGVDEAITCLALGAEDFVLQPFHSQVLDLRLKRCIKGPAEVSDVKPVAELEPATITELIGVATSPSASSAEVGDRRSGYLLRVLLPEPLISELKRDGQILPRRHQDVALLSVAVVGLHRLCDTFEPVEILSKLQSLTMAFEDLATAHRFIELRSSEASFLGAVGLFEELENPVLRVTRLALGLQHEATRIDADWKLRIGIHVGSLVTGVIGRRKYRFDAWGSSLDFVRFVRDQGSPGSVHLSAPAWQQVADMGTGGPIGQVRLSENQTVTLYRLSGLKS